VAHTQDNEPLLSLAIQNGHKAIAVALIEAGAYVNARGVRAARLCMLALANHYYSIARRASVTTQYS
jgi:hypothetical protein